ncbi:MAG TPA: hypothetical protein ENI05_03210 [Porticoccus sp.]|nr:hypothetical protein [Porticoccus sp.]
MNTTINEEIAHDCVQELLEKLADERKLSSDQNVRITELEEQVGQAMDLSHEELAVVMAMRSTGALNAVTMIIRFHWDGYFKGVSEDDGNQVSEGTGSIQK